MSAELTTRIEVGHLVVKTVALSPDELKDLVARIQEMVLDADASLVTPYPVEITNNGYPTPDWSELLCPTTSPT